MKNRSASSSPSSIVIQGLSSDITKAYAWHRDQCDEREELLIMQGADLTEYCTRDEIGRYHSAKPVLIERGASTEVDSEESDEDSGADNGLAICDPKDIEAALAHAWDNLPEPNDEYSRMAEQLLGDLDDMPEPVTAAEPDYSDIEARLDSKMPAKPSNTYSFLLKDFSVNWMIGRITGKEIIRKDNRYLKLDLKSWKATTMAQCQFLRHKRSNQRQPAFASHTLN